MYFNDIKSGCEVYLLLYVDDILLPGPSKSQIKELKDLLKSEFDMKDLGNVRKILGMVITRDVAKNMLTISQEAYLTKVVAKFGMKDSRMFLLLVI